MTIWVESQTVIQCDQCQDTLIEALRKQDTIVLANKHGWHIGNRILCPKCFEPYCTTSHFHHWDNDSWGNSGTEFEHTHENGNKPHGHHGARYGKKQ